MYEHVLSPIEIGGVTIPNRVVRTAHATGIGGGTMSDDLIEYHAARARGGVGLTILEILSVHLSSPATLNVSDPGLPAGYQKLMAACEPHGMKIFQQIWHGGHNGSPVDGSPPWSASDIPSPQVGVVPRPMTKSQIDEIIEAYANTVKLCRDNGLNGIEIHGAHGYLPQQFLSQNTNVRDDEYGGSLENRMRFLIEIMQACFDLAKRDGFAIGVRLAADATTGGIGSEENIAVVEALKAKGLADFVNVSLGSYHSFPKLIGGMHEPAGYELESAVPVTQSADVPTIVTGRFRTMEEVDQVIRTGQSDMVGMTRATIADPDLVNKTRAGDENRVRPCIACNQGCVGQLLGPERKVGCAVNAGAGFERTLGDDKLIPAPVAKLVLVIGGGPAGMEAARVAAKRGHNVTLAEAMPDLGGTLTLAARAPTRQQFGDFVHWQSAELFAEGVDVKLSTYLTPEDIDAFNADEIIVATGAEPRMDGIQMSHPGEPIEGIHLPHVISSNELFEETEANGTHALIVDDVGHYEGLAAAEHLANQGLKVTLVTRLPTLAPGVRTALMTDPALERLGNKDFTYHVGTRVLKTDGQSASLQAVTGGESWSVNADKLVFISLNRPRNELSNSLASHGVDCHIIGDANSPRFLVKAVAEGNAAGRSV
ncbi:MAG: 2,4-dienoyl-CoA reductase-like NADH-dependent reductase (Old Yellow Enzyme family) [Candidatus Azotimanducaceae bacterium]|jgi:2,4-dienoyl-CoA reductase-like NADH-dependent reductase (Old Yellow Enzyme family)/thioredoxin reductase